MSWLCGSGRAAVDQEQLELGTDGGGAGPEAGPFQQLPERGQALFEPLPEVRVVALVELCFGYVGSHGRLTVLGRAAAAGCGSPPRFEGPSGARIRRPVSTAGRTRT